MITTHLEITNHNLQEISHLLSSFMIIGVIATSMNGAIRAIKARMDITGAILLAFITSNAGGTIRDLLLGQQIFWIKEQFYVWLTLIIGALTFFIIYNKRHVISSRLLYKFLIVTDAMGLAAFSLAGIEKAIAFNQNNTIAVIMGIWTAIGGGIIADVVSNQVPQVLSEELYITVSFIGAVIYLYLNGRINNILAGLIAAIIMVLLRIYSVKFNWRLPTI